MEQDVLAYPLLKVTVCLFCFYINIFWSFPQLRLIAGMKLSSLDFFIFFPPETQQMHRYVCQGLGRNYPPEVVAEKLETRDRDEGWWMANWRWKMTGSSCGDGSHPIKMSSMCVFVLACILIRKQIFETRGANMCVFSLFMVLTNTEAGAFTYIHSGVFRPSLRKCLTGDDLRVSLSV